MATPSSMAGELGPLKTSFTWQLDIQLLNTTQPLEVLHSPIFHANGSRWRLELYPRGAKPGCEDYISFFLRYLGTSKDGVTANLIFCVLNNKNEKFLYHETEENRFKPGLDLGVHRFFKRDVIAELIHNILTSDKKIRLFCEITSKPSNEVVVTINLNNLFNNQKFSDIKFCVENRTLHAHKNILANKSTVFAAMFEHNMKENLENVVNINDIEYEVVLELLRFIYTGKVNNIANVAQNLLIAADKYDLPDLKIICGEALCHDLSIENSLKSLQFAHSYGVEVLERKAMEFIVSNVKEMVNLPGFNLILKLPEEITMKFIRRLAFKKDDIATCITIDD